MRSLLYMILVVMSLQATKFQTYLHQLQHLNYKQKAVLFRTYNKAKKFDLQFTMTAIAWHESHFNLYPLNLDDPSFGVFHNNIKSVCSRHKCSKWNRSRLAERLLFDYNFSFAEALAELQYWKNYYHSSHYPWSNTVMSYNCGYRTNKKQCKKYLKEIKYKIKMLRYFFKTINYK